jgi:predicted nucleic acid-binding protein
MSIQTLHANCLDASALVKLHIEETRSDILRQYLGTQSTYYYTLFCYFETLSALKRKWLCREISKDKYHDASFSLTADFSFRYKEIPDLDFTDTSVFNEGQVIAKQYSLDLSDAFQILSIKKGYFKPLVGKSSTLLITADNDLAKAARSEKIRVWNLMNDPLPD